MRVLGLEHLQHFILAISVKIDVSIFKEELNELLLVRQFRLPFQQSEERCLVLVIREVRIASSQQQDFDAFRDIRVVDIIRQKVN